jgi:hypothetical protein
VLRHNATFLSAQLYHFGAEPRAMGAQFLRLLPGNYSCVLSFPKREKPHANHTHFNVTAFGEFLEVPGSGLAEFHLAPRELVLLTVKRATREPGRSRAPTGLPSATPVPSASPAPSAVDDVGSRTPKPSRQPTRAPAPEPTDAYDYGGVLSPITEAMYVACGALDAAPSDAEVYDIVVDALDANCGDCCRIADCGEICAGLSCAAYAPATCAAVKFEYGCECDGCRCSSSYGYGNYTNSTSSSDSSAAKPDVVALTIFTLMGAFFIYCVHKYLKSQREEREYQKRKAAKKEMLAKQVAHIELEIVENETSLEKGEADDEIKM